MQIPGVKPLEIKPMNLKGEARSGSSDYAALAIFKKNPILLTMNAARMGRSKRRVQE
jgi:hypothetical protein